MKKTILVCGFAILLLIAAISGCVEDKKEQKTKTYSGTETIEESG